MTDNPLTVLSRLSLKASLAGLSGIGITSKASPVRCTIAEEILPNLNECDLPSRRGFAHLFIKGCIFHGHLCISFEYLCKAASRVSQPLQECEYYAQVDYFATLVNVTPPKFKEPNFPSVSFTKLITSPFPPGSITTRMVSF